MMTRSTNMEHVEVLRRAADELRRADALARKSNKIDRRKVIGRAADNNLSVILSALDSLSAKQPAAAGEEIMVNAAHDVYTLPLQPSGLLSGPRFVVHVPGPEAQAAEAQGVVDEGSRSVTRQLLHWGGVPVHVTGTVTTSPGNWSLIDAALAAQQGGSDNDR